MKNLVKTGALIFVLLISLSITAQVRPGFGQANGQVFYRCNNIPNLTAEQQTKITALRTAHLKKMQNYRLQMAQKRVELQTLRVADKPDMNAINKTIDEISVIRTQMMKDREKHRQDVRNLLDQDQKVYFDSFNRGRACMGYGMGRGFGRGGGFCRGAAW